MQLVMVILFLIRSIAIPTVLFCLLLSCKSKYQGSGRQLFCDGCELGIIKEVFAIDSVKIFYKDYSDPSIARDAMMPIDNRYLRTIDMKNFVGDTAVFNHFDSIEFGGYERSIQSDSILKKGNYVGFEKAILCPQKIKEIPNKQAPGKYIRISKPIFDTDKTFSLIEVDYNCFGLCGEGYTYILIKKDNKWTLYKKILRWVS